MPSYQITRIDKPGGSHNPRRRILRVGGIDWWLTTEDAIRIINAKLHQFYVAQGNTTSWVEVAYRDGIPYLRTESDRTPLDNLLSLQNVSTV